MSILSGFFVVVILIIGLAFGLITGWLMATDDDPDVIDW